MFIAVGLGMIFGLFLACIIAVIICDKQKLQEIKPYYAYKGRTWTALDMAIKKLQEEEDEE